jgi:hypothetical protein
MKEIGRAVKTWALLLAAMVARSRGADHLCVVERQARETLARQSPSVGVFAAQFPEEVHLVGGEEGVLEVQCAWRRSWRSTGSSGTW